MKRTGRTLVCLLALMTGPVAIAMTATPASGGASPELTVTKVVDGTAPPGAQFVVDIDCEGADIQPSSQLTFTGPGSQTVEVNDTDITCTVVESNASGASVTYACEITTGLGETACTSNQSVFFDSGGTRATITVTNSYPAPAPGSSEPGAPPAAEPVTAAARFTG